MEDMLSNMRLAAPAADGGLVQLLSRWASAGRLPPSQMQPAHSCCVESAGAHHMRLQAARELPGILSN